ncbi:hypothetical protein B0H11DRAFT_2355194 [Mycena galericulata]|nr:hypothetical protein B0H11DRAFT_2355194 [Mycena galericulata]
MSYFSYTILVLRWGSPTAFVDSSWSAMITPISGGLTSAIVQIFFARRIYILKGDRLWARFVASLIVLLALMQSLAGIINEAPIAKNQELSTMKNLLIGARVWLIGSAVCDIVITSSMIFILDQYRRRTPWKQTDTIIKKLIFNTVETGAVTTIVAIVEAILFVLYPTNNLGQFPASMLGPLYALVLVVSLNVRADMAPASFIATPYTQEIHWGRPDPEQVTDLEALRTVHSGLLWSKNNKHSLVVTRAISFLEMLDTQLPLVKGKIVLGPDV